MSHPLDGCRAKIDRAKETIDNLNAEINAFLFSEPKPYKVIRDRENDGRNHVFRAAGDPDVPLRFAVLAGEVVHHLRSVLDHLVCALAIVNGEAPTRNSQFPVCATAEKYEEACNRGLIKGVSRSAKKLIRSMQPYNCAIPEHALLTVLHDYDILDKHRLLVVVAAAARLGERIEINLNSGIPDAEGKFAPTPTNVLLGDDITSRITKDGAKIFEIIIEGHAPEFQANAEIIFQIAFEKFGHAKLMPVVRGLDCLLEATGNTLNLFAAEFP